MKLQMNDNEEIETDKKLQPDHYQLTIAEAGRRFGETSHKKLIFAEKERKFSLNLGRFFAWTTRKTTKSLEMK